MKYARIIGTGSYLPKRVLTNAELEKMVDVSLVLEPLWENALGADWKRIMTREKIRSLYRKM